jgi:hypothetical protein
MGELGGEEGEEDVDIDLQEGGREEWLVVR